MSEAVRAASREAMVAAADEELAEVAARLKDQRPSKHPELFDASGRLRPEAYRRALSDPFGEKRTLTREDVLALGQGDGVPTNACEGLHHGVTKSLPLKRR